MRKYSVNDDFFASWSHDMAYILGFWWADGCIFKKEFHIGQNKKDEYLLKKMAVVMNSSYPLSSCRSNNNVELWVTSEKIVKDIKKLGGTERKSLICEFPKVPRTYLPDFVRGLWDGDGSVYKIIRRRSYESSFTCGSEKFARSLYGILRAEIPNIGGCFQKKIKRAGEKLFDSVRSVDSIYYSIRFSNNDSVRLRNFLYSTPSTLRMERKYRLFVEAGTIRSIKKGFLPYEYAQKIVLSFGIRSKTEWVSFCRQGLRRFDIPASPNRTYKMSGWKTWKDWLGYRIEKVKGD